MGRARVLVIDNYDSFTWNLVQALGALGAALRVLRNDEASVEDALTFAPSHVLISPGPGHPRDAGLSLPLLAAVEGRLPTLGVCLGHQAMALRRGAPVVRARRLVHGEATPVHHDGSGLFAGLPSPLSLGRYHSLIVDPASPLGDLTPNAWSDEGEIMGLRGADGLSHGLQFHPESVLSPQGPALLAAFLALSAPAGGAAR
jgi:anthranilate synthase/aminodeoxychorismate synthase-like glutamine amidotransferase